MPLLTAREMRNLRAEGRTEGFCIGLVVGLVTMAVGAILGARIAVWWLGGA